MPELPLSQPPLWDAAAEQSPKRVRLRSKTTVPPGAEMNQSNASSFPPPTGYEAMGPRESSGAWPCSPTRDALRDIGVLWRRFDAAAFEEMDKPAKYWTVYNRFRYWAKSQETRSAGPSESPPARPEGSDGLRSPFSELSRKNKAALMDEFARSTRAPECILAYIASKWNASYKGRNLYLDAATVFLTYQGAWGLFPLEHLTKDLSEEAVSCALRERAQLQDAWKAFLRFAHGICQ